MATRLHIFDLTAEAFEAMVIEWGMPRFRARQVLNWVYQRGVIDPQRMNNLSKADRRTLAENLAFARGQASAQQHASDGTQKLLLDWDADSSGNTGLPVLEDGTGSAQNRVHQTECVMIPAVSRESGKARRTACISSQVGCPVGCRFCASGLGGLEANLTAGQIVEQAWRLAHLPDHRHLLQTEPASDHGPTQEPPGLTNIVFMGMGEPLANFKQVTRAIGILTADWGLNFSPRRITLSTVGLPAPIRRLADQDLGVTLALSLHAPNDSLRRRIIPWAEFVSIDQLIDAGRYYFDQTGREITLEYILLGGVNDQPHHAKELAQVARRLRSNINLIRYNEVAPLAYHRPSDADVHRFQTTLRDAGLNTHVRASRGRDIAAACGQLRHQTASQT